jgi:hypothetical protein
VARLSALRTSCLSPRNIPGNYLFLLEAEPITLAGGGACILFGIPWTDLELYSQT